MSSLTFDPIIPFGAVILLGLFLGALTVAIYWRVGTTVGPVRNIVLLLFRLLGVALVLVILLQPSRLEIIPPKVTQRVTLVAVDNSKSMAQRDVVMGSRTDAARSILTDAGLLDNQGKPANERLRLFKFSETGLPVKTAAEFEPAGATTRIHSSVTGILDSIHANEAGNALILLSDGHDFELINPAKTGLAARARQIPIYAVSVGKQGKVRDVAARITNYQPYSYVKQKARISVALRLMGCELETITVTLLREGKPVQVQKVKAGDSPELALNFEVVEPVAGQFQYQVKAVPLEGEIDRLNNEALTYLNVIDQQIQVLFLEGAPYWDTTFFQRSLMRNEKMNVDSVVQYAKDKVRIVRKVPSEKEMKVPASIEDWARYDVVVLGRSIENILGVTELAQLEDYVKNRGGTVIFSRGRAFNGQLAQNELEPVIWSESASEHVRLIPAREGQSLAPLRLLAEHNNSAAEAFPTLIAVHGIKEKKPLAAIVAVAQGVDGAEPVAGMIHRRFGEGQVLSMSVDGLWRWAFNSKVEGVNTFYDRFWDQTVLWLMAGRDFLPTKQFSVRASSANIALGEKISFRAVLREPSKLASAIPLVISRDSVEVARSTLSAADPQAPDKLTAEFLAAKTGPYQAVARFPDGSTQVLRFIVFDDNVEQTEVSNDSAYLRRLCESSGGRLLEASELGRLVAELHEQNHDSTPKTRLCTVWDQAWVFWLIGLLLGADWYLRRRWGLC